MLTTWNKRGVTLIEILLAGAAAVVVVVGVTAIDANRARMQQNLRTRIVNDADLAIVSSHFAKNLTQADRFILRDSGDAGVTPPGTMGEGDLQVRFPTCPVQPADPSCFDVAANYHWGEYWLHGGVLRYFSDTQSGCGSSTVLGEHILSATFQYKDEAAFPDPALEPFPGGVDNNAIEYRIVWEVNGATREFRSEIAGRAVPYSNVQAVAQTVPTTNWDSGQGLGPTGISEPPARCGT